MIDSHIFPHDTDQRQSTSARSTAPSLGLVGIVTRRSLVKRAKRNGSPVIEEFFDRNGRFLGARVLLAFIAQQPKRYLRAFEARQAAIKAGRGRIA